MGQPPDARRAHGRSLRASVPRSAHGDWDPPAGRSDPLEILEAQAATRVRELGPIRYRRMSESPFAFFRGGAAVMSLDLSTTPTSGIHVQACGDAHVNNFGFFGSPERNLVFDINDFDETLPGPWEWDVKRLCTSLYIVARQRRWSAEDGEALVGAAARTYRQRIADYSSWHTLDLFYERTEIKRVIQHFPLKHRAVVHRDVKRARRKDHLRAVAKLTRLVEGKRGFVEDPPLIVHLDATDHDLDEAEGLIESYRSSLSDDRRSFFDRYRLVDVARKVVGVGSVGTRCWIALDVRPRRPRRRLRRAAGQGGAALRPRALRGRVHPGPSREAGGRGTAPDPGRERHLPRVGGGPPDRSQLLRPSIVGLQGTRRPDDHEQDQPAPLRRAVRVDPCPVPRSYRRRHGDLGVPRQGHDLRPRHRRLCRPLRRAPTRPTTRRSSRPSKPAGSGLHPEGPSRPDAWARTPGDPPARCGCRPDR